MFVYDLSKFRILKISRHHEHQELVDAYPNLLRLSR